MINNVKKMLNFGIVFLCDYGSFSDSDLFGKLHNIDFPAYVSFGDIYINKTLRQATLVEHNQYKYLLVIDYLFPNILMVIVNIHFHLVLTYLKAEFLVQNQIEEI